MKTIGLIGGMSWESTAEYYRIINEAVRERLGGLHSAKMLLYSVDFQEVEDLQQRGDWGAAAGLLAGAARNLERGGANFVLICTNTMHKVAAEVEKAVTIPLLHIVDATAEKIKEVGIRRIGLLGTRYTMEEDFYTGRLVTKHGLQVLTPPEADRTLVHRVIFEELCLGKVVAESRAEFSRIIADLAAARAQGVILGCTEISLLIKAGDSHLPLFDTTEIHARRAVDLALAD
jgi:aspartate racemase